MECRRAALNDPSEHRYGVDGPREPGEQTLAALVKEIALLAGVSVTWYTWLEQGRPINASVDVLEALARSLRLDDAQRQHLLALATRTSGESIPEVEHAPDAP